MAGSSGFTTNTDSLRQCGQGLQSVARAFAQELARFQATIAEFGQPWGQDMLGSLIGAAHDEVSSWAFECYSAAQEEFEEAGRDITAMAANHQEADDTISKQITSIQHQIGGS